MAFFQRKIVEIERKAYVFRPFLHAVPVESIAGKY